MTVAIALAATILVSGLALGSVPTILAQTSPVYTGVVRSYYLAANQVQWNYTPSGMDEITGGPFGATDPGQLLYTTRNATYLGTSFLKCVYQQYTNANFTTKVPQPPWEGIMGPTLFAVVGDTIQVTFRNNCEFPESIHPHGVFYNRTSEGADYNTSAPYDEGEAVPPGGTWVYDWMVPARAGPGPDDGEAVMWMYHSHVYEPVDINDGLIGTIIVTAPGDANPDGTPKGFGMVVSLLFNIFDETQSQYESYNVDNDSMNLTAVNASGIAGCFGLGVDQTCAADPTWGSWAESMRKYTINGYSYGNLPMIDIPQGTEVLWCLMGMGEDFHTASWQGNPLLVSGARTDLIGLVPADMTDAIMWTNNTGVWLIDSVIPADLVGGMEARYDVVPAGTSTAATALASQHGVLGRAPDVTSVGIPARLATSSVSADALEAARWS